MSNYSDEDRERIHQEALQRLQPLPEYTPPTRTETVNQRVRRELSEAAEQQTERDHRLTDYEAAQFETRLEQKCADLIAHESDFLKELMAQALAEVFKRITTEVGQLRAEVNVNRGIDKSDSVIQLPNFLRKTT